MIVIFFIFVKDFWLSLENTLAWARIPPRLGERFLA